MNIMKSARSLFLMTWMLSSAHAFVRHAPPPMSPLSISLWAKPRRLPDNADGVVYVNDHCINCAACSGFAPQTFSVNGSHHIVHQQPQTAEEIHHARQALAACPVAAIRLDETASKQEERLATQMRTRTSKPLFPRLLLDSVPDVYWLGHHNRASFGAIPYLFQDDQKQWIMVDTPKFSPTAVKAVTSLTSRPNSNNDSSTAAGPDYLILTHVDDTADHGAWVERFPNLKRIFHAGDLGKHNWLNDRSLENVEILLQPLPPPLVATGTADDDDDDDDDDDEDGSSKGGRLTAYSLDGTVLQESEIRHSRGGGSPIILHTPGHSPGSISVLWKDVLFTGDTYARSARTNRMTGFPRYGNDLQQQGQTLQRLVTDYDWSVVAPGHGHSRDYRKEMGQREIELQSALEELQNRY